ncbi:hypothetical protein [Hymenobacter metallicola]|uniref:STAS/SEC14 domain-containing protein n=1 Tax=Hymenobacter metallicola TaxID=2563114 RepID=A0A4Z0PZ03_9BACT|nr:hypothetical protein [Hymenobacter metallicola]TGE22947.1 hypothetical protein E5K02_21530 [Hymenobacter metallicola]
MLAFSPVYFENAAGRVSEHPSGFAVVKWHKGVRRLEDFKEALQHLDRLLRQRRWSKLIADQRDLTPFTAEERTWTLEEWLPLAVGNGPYRFAAVLLPSDVFARLASKSIMSESQEKFLAYQFCESENEAVAWLLTQ